MKWDHVYKDLFRFRNGPFGFEIIEILIRPDWLGDVVTFDSDSDESNISSEGSETSETREKLAVAHQEFTELHKYGNGIFFCSGGSLKIRVCSRTFFESSMIQTNQPANTK